MVVYYQYTVIDTGNDDVLPVHSALLRAGKVTSEVGMEHSRVAVDYIPLAVFGGKKVDQ